MLSGLKTALKKALKHYQHVLKENPEHEVTISNLILCFQECGHLEEALALSQKSLAQFPNNPDIVNNAGVILRKKGALNSAKICFKRAATLRPDFIPAQYNLGQMYATLGRSDQANLMKYLASKRSLKQVEQVLG